MGHSSYHCCCCDHGGYGYEPHPWIWSMGSHVHGMHAGHRYLMPFVEMIGASSSQEFLIGGEEAAQLTLEYLKADAATAPSIKVVVLGPGGATTTWGEDPVTDGYHVRADVATVEPGSRVTVTTVETIARIRWWETIQHS